MSENSELVFRTGERHMFCNEAHTHTHTQNNEIDKYLKIYVEITVLYTTEMLLILQGKRRLIIPKFIIIIHGKCVRRKIIPNSWKKERLFKFQLEMICK